MLSVTSVFLSVEGECNFKGQGVWSVFVRFSGCTARCDYCDTKYSWEKGKEMSPLQLLELVQVTAPQVRNVTITGGEPLEQPTDDLLVFLSHLLEQDYEISMETNGLYNPFSLLGILGRRIRYVVDYKLPSAGYPYGRHMFNLVRPSMDYLKFVIRTDDDFEKAKLALLLPQFEYMRHIFFSPCPPMTPRELFFKIKRDGLYKANLNVQLHKYVFTEDWRDEEKNIPTESST